MPSRIDAIRRRNRTPVLGGLLALICLPAVLGVAACGGGSSTASSSGQRMESIFQDDQYLLYEPTPTVVSTLDTLRTLGVNRIRVTVLWRTIAPAASSPTPPAGFVASNPSDYPAGGFALYDRLVELARDRGIGVDFDVTAAGPLWAMKGSAPQPHYTFVYLPSATDFEQFVVALGRRYSGSYVPSAPQSSALRQLGVPTSGALPRVSYWSIWNEPNQPGWLSPQWRSVGTRRVMASAPLYRAYVDSAWKALTTTGHGASADTILVGELAPEGGGPPSLEQPIPPMDFLEALYCVDAGFKPLTGATAAALGCPVSGGASGFVKAHPGLFDATGFGHHPYSFFLPPNVSYPETDFVPLVDLSRLERGLDQIFRAYAVGRQIPIYLTEYGYETNPPNPYRGVSLQHQAAYIDEAQYMASKDPRVRSMSQFLLRDALPNPAFPPGSIGYWSTFQTGLEFSDGTKKPSFAAYRLPIWIPSPTFKSGSSVLIWGMVRPHPGTGSQHVSIQWRGTGSSYRTISTLSVSSGGEAFTAHVTLPGSGTVRLMWTSPSGHVIHSRAVMVTSG